MAASASVQIEIGNYFVRNMATTEKKEKKNTFFSVYSLSRGLSTNHVGGFGCMASTVVLRTHSSFLGVVEKKKGLPFVELYSKKKKSWSEETQEEGKPVGVEHNRCVCAGRGQTLWPLSLRAGSSSCSLLPFSHQ